MTPARTTVATPAPSNSRVKRLCCRWCVLAAVTWVAACSSQSVPADSRTDPGAQVGSAPQAREKPAGTSGSTKKAQVGMASFMADRLDGRRTASGERYDKDALVAAHATYPFGTVLRVTNQANGRVVEVRVIDRNARGAGRPLIDLSRAAAERLDFVQRGTVRVSIEVVTR